MNCQRILPLASGVRRPQKKVLGAIKWDNSNVGVSINTRVLHVLKVNKK